MTDEELREACEAAGLRPIAPEDDDVPWLEYTNEGGDCLAYDHPALLPWVESLLVAKVRANPTAIRALPQELVDGEWQQYDTADLARCLFAGTNKQRIRAAMAVLKERCHECNMPEGALHISTCSQRSYP